MFQVTANESTETITYLSCRSETSTLVLASLFKSAWCTNEGENGEKCLCVIINGHNFRMTPT
jgi:hypothetical protein